MTWWNASSTCCWVPRRRWHDLRVLNELRAAAFGACPGLADQTLARARNGSSEERWLAAVVLGARGRYAAAATLLEALVATAGPVLSSLAASTLASHRRQLGGHANAREWDAHALRRAVSVRRWPARVDAVPDPDGIDLGGALTDALLGLTADALALGRQREARRLLARIETGTVAGIALSASWRSRVRRGWVQAEVELARGDFRAACGPAERSAALAHGHDGSRHGVKSDIVLAAALAGSGLPGSREKAAGLAVGALQAARKWDLASLAWPACLVAADLDLAREQQYRTEVQEILHSALRRSDPLARELASLSPWVPVE